MTTYILVGAIAAPILLMLTLVWVGSRPRHSQILEPIAPTNEPKPLVKHMPIITNIRWPING